MSERASPSPTEATVEKRSRPKVRAMIAIRLPRRDLFLAVDDHEETDAGLPPRDHGPSVFDLFHHPLDRARFTVRTARTAAPASAIGPHCALLALPSFRLPSTYSLGKHFP